MAAQIKAVEKKSANELTELDRILLLSKPRNGELTTASVRIRESQEFKVSSGHAPFDTDTSSPNGK